MGVTLPSVTGGAPPVAVFLVGITFAAWRGGRRPALAATALATVVAAIFFGAGEGSPVPQDVRVTLMAAVGVAISLLAGSLHAARAALRQENARLHSFIAQLPAGVIVFDAQGRVVHTNDRVREILRHDPMSRVDEAWQLFDENGERIAPRDYAAARALRGETVTRWHVRYVRGDGTGTWLETSAVPFIEGGRVTGGITMFVDVGREKALALELDESRSRLELALQGANSGWFEWDVRERKSVWSPELEMMYGMAPGSYTGRHEEWRSRVHPEDVERAERDIEASLESGEFASEWRVVLPNGTVRHVFGQGRVWMDAEGRPLRMAGINMDVTAQREAEARVRAAETRLEIALEAARMGRWHLDLRTGRMEASATCRANFGRLTHETLSYEDVVAAVHPEDRASMQESVRRALEEKSDYAAEYRVIWPDGTERWIAARGRAQYDAAGAPVMMDGVTIDFTGRKRLEEELRRKTATLEEASGRKDRFLAVLGHELRNPLAPMRNAIEILRMRGADAAVRDASVGVLERQIAQATRLVEELLDVSRIAQGKIRLQPAPVPLARIMDDAVEASEPLIRARKHSLTVVGPPADAVIDADAPRLVQVLGNLLNNAAKYTDPGGQIVFSAHVSAGCAILSVRDNGIGIPRNKLVSIFEVFSQIDDVLDRSLGGLGLGLNVASRLVEMHGGTIAAHSDGPGRGSLFTVTLPLRFAPSSRAPAASPVRDAAD
jgi:PAS domain S-box-containing protein